MADPAPAISFRRLSGPTELIGKSDGAGERRVVLSVTDVPLRISGPHPARPSAATFARNETEVKQKRSKSHRTSRNGSSSLVKFVDFRGAIAEHVGSWGRVPSGRERRMLARRRRELITEHVLRHGSARVSDLTEVLGVSDMTIRRDLEALDQAGVLDKVHGGATLPADAAPTTVEPGFVVKSTTAGRREGGDRRRRRRAHPPRNGDRAHRRHDHVAPGGALDDVADLMVVTNSMRICDRLLATERTDLTVLITGGNRTPSDALVGPLAVRSLESLHLDQVFMGVHGMSERAGLHDAEPARGRDEQGVRRVGSPTRRGRRPHQVEHDRARRASPRSTPPTAVVTDRGLPADAADTLRAHVPNVVVA